MRTSTIFAFGAFGGCCPTIAKLASFYTTNPAGGLPQLGTYIGLGLFGVLGAIIAVGFGARELKAAIVAGIAAPGLVTNIVAGSTAAANAPRGQEQAALHGLFVSAAFAQVAEETFEVVPLNQYRGLRVLTLNVMLDGPAPTGAPLEFRFLDGNGIALPGGGAMVPGEPLVVPVPDGAVSIQIGEDMQQLPQSNDTLDVTVTTGPTLGGDLIWALGGQRGIRISDVDIKSQ